MMDTKKIVIAVAIILGFLLSYPHLYGLIKYKSGYLPFTSQADLPYVRDETYAYAPQVHQLLKGNFRGDSYLWEYQHSPSPFVGEAASIIPLVLLSLTLGSVAKAFIVSDFIFPSLLFLILFFALVKARYSTHFSIAAALSVVITPLLSLLAPRVQSHSTLLTGTLDQPLFFARTPHPQISSIYLFIALFSTVLLISDNKTTKSKVKWIWPIILGLSAYSSPFIFSTVLLSAVFLIPVLIKKFPTKFLLTSLFIIVMMTLPWIINFIQQQTLIANTDFLLRSTFEKNFLFPAYLRFVFLSCVLLILGKKIVLFRVLALYLLAAALLVDGHQFIFNRNLEADHWISRVLSPLATLSIFITAEVMVLRRLRPYFAKLILILVSVGFLIIAAVTQVIWTLSFQKDNLVDKAEIELIEEIIAKTKKSDTVGTLSPQLNNLIAAATGRYVYIAPGDRALAHSSEQMERICDLVALQEDPIKDEDLAGSVRYVLGLRVLNEDVIQDKLETFSCDELILEKPRYKLDYVVTVAGDSYKLSPISTEN